MSFILLYYTIKVPSPSGSEPGEKSWKGNRGMSVYHNVESENKFAYVRIFFYICRANQNKCDMIQIDTRIGREVINTTALTALKNSISRYHTMTAEEEVDAFNRLNSASTESERQAVKNEIMNANLRFLLSVAQKYTRDGDKVAELVSVGSMGMSKAVDTFEVERGFKFISYAINWIAAEIHNFFATENCLVRQTNGRKIGGKDNAIVERFLQTEMREPTEEELLSALESEYGIKVKATDVVRMQTSRIDAKLEEDSDSTAAEVGEFAVVTASRNDYEKEIEAESINEQIARLLPTLSVKEQDIIKKFFGIGRDGEMDCESIAEEYGCCAENIRRLIAKKILPKLRARAKQIALA